LSSILANGVQIIGPVSVQKQSATYKRLLISLLSIEVIAMCYNKNSRKTFSQTQLVILSFKVATCFDSLQSSSGHYLNHM